MRAWVCSEDMIRGSFDAWAEARGMDAHAGAELYGVLMDFLASPQAVKLRVRQIDPDPTPPPNPYSVIG